MLKAWNSRNYASAPTPLLWLQSDGVNYINTDFVLPSVTCPVEIDFSIERIQHGDFWPSIVSSGAQSENTSMFKLPVWGSGSIYIWFQYGIYQIHSAFTLGKRTNLLSYKVNSLIDDYRIVAYVGGVAISNIEYMGWTQQQQETFNTINFFAEIHRDGSPESNFICDAGRFYGLKVYDKDNHDLMLASFKPAMLKGVVGVYEEVSKKFYPEIGSGHLLYAYP